MQIIGILALWAVVGLLSMWGTQLCLAWAKPTEEEPHRYILVISCLCAVIFAVLWAFVSYRLFI